MTKTRQIKPDVSVVIPVYNNEPTITDLCTEIIGDLKDLGHRCEVILVNDASADNSWEAISTLSNRFSEVTGINLVRNGGQNMAIYTGLKKAQSPVILTMDADLQDDPEMISKLLQTLDKDTDVVFIKRIGQYQKAGRMLTSLLFKGFLQSITGLHRKAGSYYLIKQSVVLKMISFDCRYPIMTIMAYSLSKNVKYLPAARATNEGISSYTFRKRCYYAFRATYCAIQCRIYRLRS
ncbi:glycosyltransferase [Roseivirga sp.]|uniref:glycosyltransferase n=1 Tax=Roseivirga sp. TaxID=1964215 RepID=UPI003B8AC874